MRRCARVCGCKYINLARGDSSTLPAIGGDDGSCEACPASYAAATSCRRLWTNDEVGADPDAWLEGAVKSERSWWQDWAEWIEPRSGPRVAPPPMGGPAHPPLCAAPGTYVHVT